MSNREMNAALQSMYDIAINALQELQINSSPMDFALFCDEADQMVQDAFQMFARNGSPPQVDQSLAHTNYSVPESLKSANFLPPPTFKKPIPMKRTHNNQNEVKVGIPAGLKIPSYRCESPSEELSSDDENENRAPIVKKKINKKNKEHKIRNEKVEIEPNVEESATQDATTKTSLTKRLRKSLNQEKMEHIKADFVLNNWILILNGSQLVIKGDKYNRAQKLLESNFTTPSIKSAKKVEGKFVITASNTKYLLIESKMKNDSHIPNEVKKLCQKGFPTRWRICLNIWKQIKPTQELKNDVKKVAEPKEKNAPKPKQNNAPVKKNAKKTNEKKAPEPENNGKSIFEKILADDSFDNGNCMTPSALLNSIKKSKVADRMRTPPANFLRDLQSTSVFERSEMNSTDKKNKQKCQVIDRMSKIQKKGNVAVRNEGMNVRCEKVYFDKILPNVQETSTFCSESDSISVED